MTSDIFTSAILLAVLSMLVAVFVTLGNMPKDHDGGSGFDEMIAPNGRQWEQFNAAPHKALGLPA